MPLRQRRFLFLQGPNTPFFGRLADAVAARGRTVERVNFCAGDAAYWGLRRAVAYRGHASGIAAFLDREFGGAGITDIVLFGDRRPVHRAALAWAHEAAVHPLVFEEGYLRPYWVTLESGGVNSHSPLPRDPGWFREAARQVPALPSPQGFHAPFFMRAAFDVLYHVAGTVDPLAYSGYRRHAPEPAPLRYAGYLRRFARLRMVGPRDRRRALEVSESHRPYFLLPLQLGGDAQIRDHSPFNAMREVIEHVTESFARHADSSALLVIKNHPLDYGLVDYRQLVGACARRFDLGARLVYLEDGDLQSLVMSAEGIVTVNSTVGFVALQNGIPTHALAEPMYKLPGLTAPGRLDDFWNDPRRPDEMLYADFERVLVATTQVNGGFYSAEAIKMAIKNSLPVLLGEPSPYRVPLSALPDIG